MQKRSLNNFFVAKLYKFSTIVNQQKSPNKFREFPLNLGRIPILFNTIQLYNNASEYLFTHANMPHS